MNELTRDALTIEKKKDFCVEASAASPFPFHFNFSLSETQIFVETFILGRSEYEQNEENYWGPARLFAQQ